MNERIKELVYQADFIGKKINGDEWRWGYIDPELNSKLEKFAELIIRECGKVIINGGYRNPAFGDRYPITPPDIAKMIEEHFGVE